MQIMRHHGLADAGFAGENTGGVERCHPLDQTLQLLHLRALADQRRTLLRRAHREILRIVQIRFVDSVPHVHDHKLHLAAAVEQRHRDRQQLAAEEGALPDGIGFFLFINHRQDGRRPPIRIDEVKKGFADHLLRSAAIVPAAGLIDINDIVIPVINQNLVIHIVHDRKERLKIHAVNIFHTLLIPSASLLRLCAV